MYLAPFGSVMDNLPVAAWVRDLFGYTSSTLKKLIVDMPFDSLPPWIDHLNVGPVLLEGFERLENLEEFVCTRNAARLSVRDETGESRSILYRWPKLQRLALNRPSCDVDFWENLADLTHLHHVVLTGAIGNIRHSLDFREVYLQRASTQTAITIVLAEVREHTVVLKPRHRRENNDYEDNRLRLMSFKIGVPERKTFLDSNSEWLMGTALAGELWDNRGQQIADVPQLAVPYPQVAELE